MVLLLYREWKASYFGYTLEFLPFSGADVHELTGRADEHGRTMETENGLRSRLRGVTVRIHTTPPGLLPVKQN